jgi:hypothetical protein
MKLKNFDRIDNLTLIQHLIIRVCLTTNKEEREKIIRDWEEQVIINDLDFSSSRLIPIFFHGNQQYGTTTRYDKRLNVIYKHWWLRTQHISHQLTRVHKALFDAGIQVIVIKGASIKMHYKREELRPMADFDLLIHPADLKKAFQIIKSLGYLSNRLSEVYWEKNENIFLDFHHAISFKNQNNDTQIDLHWRVGSRCSTQFTNQLWLHLEDYKNVPNAHRPQLAYEVFMILIHAVDSDSRDNLNWIIDIAVINEKADHSFWDEARKLAVDEKKEDLFDYACSILIQLGIYAPAPKTFKKPRTLAITPPEYWQQMNYIKILQIKIQNIRYTINRLFPYSNAFIKLYQMTRLIHFYFIIRSFRYIKP